MFNAVGGSMLIFAGAWPRMLPSDFRVRSLDGDRGRLAADLRRAAPVLRAERPRPSACRGWAATRPTRPGARIRRCRRCRSGGRAQGRAGPHEARLALVAGAELDPVRPVRRAPAVRPAGHVPAGLQRGRQGVDRPDPLAEGDRPRGAAGHRRAGPADRDERAPASRPARPGSTGTAPSTSSRPRSSSSPRTRSARRGCCCSRPVGRHPDGLANSSGLVGKRLMMHPFANVGGLFDEDLESWQGQFGCSIESFEFYETDERRGFVRGAKWGLAPTFGPINAALPSRAGDAGLGPGPPPPRQGAPRPRRELGPVRRGPARTRRTTSRSPRR